MIAGQDHLEGDDAIEPQLASLVDDPHAAPAQLSENLVAGDGRNGRSRTAAAGERQRRASDRLRPAAADVPALPARRRTGA